MAAPIFQTYAPEYAAAGLTVLPVGGEDGKRPLVPYWPKFGPRSHARFLDKFANANIAIVDGKEVTRVDIDDPDLIDSAVKRFGDTPIKVRTPSGGLHLWYRSNGERRQIRIDGLKIDILGIGGIGLAPPSKHPSKGAYSFLEGCLGDLHRLPTIQGPLPCSAVNNAAPVSHKTLVNSDAGGRNNELFKICLREARGLSSDTELMEAALQHNTDQFDTPLSIEEVSRLVQSAWGIEASGQNWIGGPARAVITSGLFERLDPSSLHLYARLVLAHGWRKGGQFKLYTGATAKSLGWGRTRFNNARNRLIETGDLRAIDLPKQGEQRPAIVALKSTIPKWD